MVTGGRGGACGALRVLSGAAERAAEMRARRAVSADHGPWFVPPGLLGLSCMTLGNAHTGLWACACIGDRGAGRGVRRVAGAVGGC